MLRIQINIQSISDIITNSSSEVFCTITGKDLEEVQSILGALFKTEYSEDFVRISITDETVEVWMPYNLYEQSAFFKAGLEAILKDLNCNIEYNEEY